MSVAWMAPAPEAAAQLRQRKQRDFLASAARHWQSQSLSSFSSAATTITTTDPGLRDRPT